MPYTKVTNWDRHGTCFFYIALLHSNVALKAHNTNFQGTYIESHLTTSFRRTNDKLSPLLQRHKNYAIHML